MSNTYRSASVTLYCLRTEKLTLTEAVSSMKRRNFFSTATIILKLESGSMARICASHSWKKQDTTLIPRTCRHEVLFIKFSVSKRKCFVGGKHRCLQQRLVTVPLPTFFPDSLSFRHTSHPFLLSFPYDCQHTSLSSSTCLSTILWSGRMIKMVYGSEVGWDGGLVGNQNGRIKWGSA